MGRRIWTLALLVACVSGLEASAQVYRPTVSMEVRTLVVKYFPVKGDRIDQNWWIFIADFDSAMQHRTGLTEAAGDHRPLP